ncbi:MAG: HAMP domain-containing sensor histidine kinase [Polyangiaceae bacterium]
MLKRCRHAVAPLHRRIFLWFGLTIITSTVVGFSVANLIGGTEWHRPIEGAKEITARRFAEGWDDPARVHALAEELHDEMGWAVLVRDERGTVLESIGPSCDRPSAKLYPKRDGRELGQVELCQTNRRPEAGILGLLAGVLVLWLVSHKVARHIGRPITRLVSVTDAIGRGQYDVEIKTTRHAPLEIVALNRAVEDMAGKIKKQMADQRELLASVSHELRSPLARIRLLLEFLRDGDLPAARQATLVDDVEREVVEIDDLVGGLLAQSRLDFSALSRRPVDIEGSVKRALDRASVPLDVAVRGTPRSIPCDATLLARALANLLDNGQKHGQGVTDIELEYDDRGVTIAVMDRGPGLEPGDEERVFDPFFGRPKGAADSLGLGLALVQRIARAHGGEATAKNRPGGGAVVSIRLPA